MTIRIPLGTVLAALLLIALGAGTAVGVMLWEPWDGGDGDEAVAEASPTAVLAEPTPTPYQKQLTGAEAATIVSRAKNDENLQFVLTNTPTPPYYLKLDTCDSVDFNEAARAWIVECDATFVDTTTGRESPQPTLTYRLYDATKIIELVLR